MNIRDKNTLIDSILTRIAPGSSLRDTLPFGCGASLYVWVSENKKIGSSWVTMSGTLNRIDTFLKMASQEEEFVAIHEEYEDLLNRLMADMKLYIYLRGDYNPWVFESCGILNPEQEAVLCLQPS